MLTLIELLARLLIATFEPEIERFLRAVYERVRRRRRVRRATSMGE